MNIAIFFTGGTISCKEEKGVLAPTKDYFLIQEYNRRFANTIQFTYFDVLNTLSENLTLDNLKHLITTIRNTNLDIFDGIIITHGTDTLGFSSKALFYTLHDIVKPICIVSSYASPHETPTNAFANFHEAINIIQEQQKGIYVPYQNPSSSSVERFMAQTLMQSPQLSNHFYAVPETFIQTTPALYKPSFSKNLLHIRPYIGLDYTHFNLENVEVVFHEMYHSGTVNQNDAIEFITTCMKRNIPIFFGPIEKKSTYYASTKALLDAGAHCLYNLNSESILMLLLLAYGEKNREMLSRIST